MEPNDDSALVHADASGRIVLAVADGVGGGPLGYKASGIAMACLSERLDADDEAPLRPRILDAFEQANEEILDLGIGAATTLTVLAIENRVARVFQVGDSMALAMGGKGVIKYISNAHSPVGYAVQGGCLDEDEAMHHEYRHFVSNLVGTHEMHIELGPPIPLAPRDTLLVATDGLFDNLHLSEITALACRGTALQRCKRLVALAEQRMRMGDENQPGKPDDLALLLLTP
ncbi:MAG: protein phosphatase 2C domain-containing protein [Planctomycetota bacterium]